MSRNDSFNVELAGALEVAATLSNIPARILQAQKRALGTVRRRLATEAKRDIGAEYNLKASRIAQGLSARNVTDGIKLVGKSRGINAIEFGARWQRTKRGKLTQGANYSIKRGGAREDRGSAFIAVGASGNRLVFERQGKARLPLQGVYGPSIGQMLKHGRRPQRLAEFALRILEAEQRRLLGSK